MLDIASGRTIPLTKDGDPGTIENGRACWSPDGQWIGYIQSDSSAVPKRAVLVPGDPTYRTFREIRYERVGEPISALRIGIIAVTGAPTRWSSCGPGRNCNVRSATAGHRRGTILRAGIRTPIVARHCAAGCCVKDIRRSFAAGRFRGKFAPSSKNCSTWPLSTTVFRESAACSCSDRPILGRSELFCGCLWVSRGYSCCDRPILGGAC